MAHTPAGLTALLSEDPMRYRNAARVLSIVIACWSDQRNARLSRDEKLAQREILHLCRALLEAAKL